MGNTYKKPTKDIVWLQISAGQGPKECGWVAAQVSKKMLAEAKNTGKELTVEVVDHLAYEKRLRKQNIIDIDAYLSLLIRIEGENAKAFSRLWEGAIKWHGESVYRPGHKRLNWFVGVERVSASNSPGLESQAYDEKALMALTKEIDFSSCRSGGPGGQHVNKTNSAVLATHRTSGIKVRVESDRSQHRNKKLATERIYLRLLQQSSEDKKAAVKGRWLKHYDVKRGNPIRTFFGPDFV